MRFNSKAIMPILLLFLVAAFVFYWRVGVEGNPGVYQVRKGNYRLEDGQFDEALKEFEAALTKNPDNAFAHLGLALTYMQNGQDELALVEFDRTLTLAPDLAVAYADKGILFDRMGEYRQALDHYKKALTIDRESVEGPGFMVRFMRNEPHKSPDIYDRAVYLQKELAKPESERLLKVPEIDQKQLMYKAN